MRGLTLLTYVLAKGVIVGALCLEGSLGDVLVHRVPVHPRHRRVRLHRFFFWTLEVDTATRMTRSGGGGG